MSKLTRKEQIIIKAAQLFKDKGYSAVSMRDLANACDVKASSLYNHIESKHNLLADIILKVAYQFTSGLQDISKSENSAFVKAKQIIQHQIEIAVNHSDALACMNTDWMHLEGQEYAEYMTLRNSYVTHFKAILEQGIKDGEIESYDVEFVIYNILSTLGSLYRWVPKRTDAEIARMREQLPMILLNGIIAK